MFTRCPECNTTFRVTAAQLKAATGKVRCSNCNTVFNSLETLEDDPDDGKVAARPAAKKAPAKKKAVPYGKKPGPSTMAKVVYLLMAPVLIAGLVVQYAFFQGAQLVAYYPQTAPYVTQLCQYLPCEAPAKRDISKIETLSRDMRDHPELYKAVVLSAIITNKAKFTQPYPGLVLTFLDRDGKTVARRTFRPKQYLANAKVDIKAGMKPNTPVYLKLELVEPSHDNTNFQIDFR